MNPYYVYFRDVWTGAKGKRSFRTREALDRFVMTAPARYAITAHN